jgi:hypothetical protein
MHSVLKPQLKDSQRLFGELEREIIYYRDGKMCQDPKGQKQTADFARKWNNKQAKSTQSANPVP